MNARARAGSISIDLDNSWAYARTHGDHQWAQYPDFLAVAIPRALTFLTEMELTATFFIVGRDAEHPTLKPHFYALGAAGHEIANHSYDHRIDIHELPILELREDFDRAEQAIREATGISPIGFRGPSFRNSDSIRHELVRRGYRYDSSDFPTSAGPLARAYHRMTATEDASQQASQRDLFGRFTDGFGPLKPYEWRSGRDVLFEIPVTTFPIIRLPIHMTYVNFIADRSARLAAWYFAGAVKACAVLGVPFTFLLHATDFIGGDDASCPTFLPGMKRTYEKKRQTLTTVTLALKQAFEIGALRDFARAALAHRDDESLD